MLKKLILTSTLLFASALFAGSHHCHFTKKISYSGFNDKTANSLRNIDMWVVYRIDGKDLLTKPDGVKKTYTAKFKGKYLSRRGSLFYIYKSRKGYIYGVSKDRNLVIEITPTGKTVLTGYCMPI